MPNKYELTDGDLEALFEAALDGVVQRGRANLRDKTMVDAITPAVEELRKAAAEGVDTVGALRRASYLGERSIGHQGTGATSSYLIVKAFLDTIGAHTWCSSKA